MRQRMLERPREHEGDERSTAEKAADEVRRHLADERQQNVLSQHGVEDDGNEHGNKILPTNRGFRDSRCVFHEPRYDWLTLAFSCSGIS